MSIDVQTEIRNTCLYEGGHFAVLMAMADCANTSTGEGIYPGIDLLAANARLKQRRTQDILQELRNDRVAVLVGPDGEDIGPEVQPTGGRGKKTEYRIDLERVQELQGLHEEAGGDCPFCLARRKREQWRAEARARKGAISSVKGAIPDTKGAISDIKGAIPSTHIGTNEPSVNPHTDAGARESGNVASLGREDFRRWPEFRSAIADTWPGGFPDDNEAAAKAEFGRQTRSHPAETLIECAKLHGQEMVDRQKARSGSAGKMLIKSPSSWLRSGGWQGYQRKILERDEAEGRITRALGNVARAVGPELFDFFRAGLEMTDDVIARLDGIEIDMGPPVLILVKSGLARLLVERHLSRLHRKLGIDLEIRQVATAPPKSSTGPN
jgi:hypothetical protein